MLLYLLIKWVHVFLAIVAVGANITYSVWLARAARDPQHLPFVLRGVQILDDRIANPCYIALLITGGAMVGISGLSFTTPWVLTSLILFVIATLGGFLGYTPVLRRQIRLAEAGQIDSDEYRTAAQQGQRLGMGLGLVVAVIIFLMVVKPSLWA
jgi:uncharacterized membrane protein